MAEKTQWTDHQDIVGDGISSVQKVREPYKENGGRGIRYVLIGICTVFLFLMLVLPLVVIITNALRDEIGRAHV